MQDITQTWISDFVSFACRVHQLKKENLLYLREKEYASSLYEELKSEQKRIKSKNDIYVEFEEVHKEIMRLTRWGILKYGLILCVMEFATLGSILVLKLMIDFLKDPTDYGQAYAIALFFFFCLLRIVAILSRSYYDMHVYNYFRFVQTKVQCWLFELTCSLRQW